MPVTGWFWAVVTSSLLAASSSVAAVVGMSAVVPVDVTVVATDLDATAVITTVQAMWAELDAQWSPSSSSPRADGLARVVVRTAFSLPAHQLAVSQPGTIELRSPSGPGLDERTLVALRHEVVHQYLWRRCPQAARDRLFHEAMAVAVSGEVAVWKADGYLSMPQAIESLQRADLDTPMARRALARIVSEDAVDGDVLSPALMVRARRCQDQAPWTPTTVDELVGAAAVPVGDALVVLHRVTGEVLEAQGAVDVAMPFGSTLKPIMVAAAVADGRPLPRLKPRPGDPMWACGEGLPATVDVAEALRRSCNGWFLDWAAQEPSAIDLDTSGWGPVLLGLGLTRLPTDMSEAIGVRSALLLSPRGLAEAWRLLMLTSSSLSSTASPDVKDILRARGTLDGAHGVDGLKGMVAKTGTVRDGHSRPMLGLLVAADDDLVIVRVRAGAPARALVDDVVAARRRHQGRHQQTVTVQTLGLVPAAGVVVGCDGVAVVVGRSPRRWPMNQRTTSLWSMLGGGADTRAVCAGGPWQVQPTAGIAERPYAGTFSASPAPPLGARDATATARQLAARRGSDVVFATARGRYVEGVLSAEDSQLRGEARVALARVIDHNVDHADERHAGRPICDTTHCQTFLGTSSSSSSLSSSSSSAAVEAAVATPLSATGRSGWLPFSQGGSTPWTETRSAAQVRGALGTFGTIAVKDDVVMLLRTTTDRHGSYDEPQTMPCEVLRSRLRLPSCPGTITAGDAAFVFEGTGAGHGLGLAVETARAQSAAGLSASAILDAAYPPQR